MTRLDYRLSSGRRDVRLLDGEALFFVHKDAAHPFIVRVGDYEARALGTAFNVRLREGEVQISILEGLVSVEAVAGPRAGRTLAQLTPGEKISLDAVSDGTDRVEHLSLEAVAPWREHTVSYTDVPITQVVADLNRFFSRPLRVSDPELARRKVSLYLQIEDRDTTLAALGAILGVRLRNDGEADVPRRIELRDPIRIRPSRNAAAGTPAPPR